MIMEELLTLDDFNPMEIAYSWESLFLSVIVYTITKSIKEIVKIVAVKDRSKEIWFKNVVMPVLPLVIGSLSAVLFPFKPQAILRYSEVNEVNKWLVYAGYGAVVGQFADYMHHRIKDVLEVASRKKTKD